MVDNGASADLEEIRFACVFNGGVDITVLAQPIRCTAVKHHRPIRLFSLERTPGDSAK